MDIKKKTIFFFCLFLVLLFTKKTFRLRTLGLEYVPEVGEILDENDFAWIGKSILTTGVPTAWSDFEVYSRLPDKKVTLGIEGFSISINGQVPTWRTYRFFPKPVVKVETLDYGKGDRYIRFVQPYLDHPPLAGIIYALGVGKESKTFKDIPPSQFRYPTVWLSVATGLLLFFLGTQLYGAEVGLMAFLFYSTVPSFIFATRLALAENVLTPFFLASVNLLLLGKKLNKRIFFFLAGILAGLSGLTKLSGWSVILCGILLLLIWQRTKKEFLFFFFPAVVLAGLYFVWSFYLAGPLIWQIILGQSARTFWGAVSNWHHFSRVNLLHFPLDGWWLGGFIILAFIFSFKEYWELLVISGSYLLTVLFLGGGSYAWYYFPFIPFLSLAVAILIKRLVVNFSFLGMALFFIFPFSSSFYWGFTVFHQGASLQWLYRLIILFFVVSGVVILKRDRQNPLIKFCWFIFWVFLVHRLYLWNYRSVLYLLENWGKLPFPLILIG